MKTSMRTTIMIGVFLALVAIWATDTQAKAKTRGVRAELAVLKARIAQLESAVEFQMRRQAASIRPFPVGGICTDPCAVDSDGDGTGDCEDSCPCDAGHVDGDGDGVPDCLDPCPGDATDACIDPCRMDSDGDGQADCEDPCRWDPANAADRDGDGVADCADPCPDDARNDCFAPCPLDSDGDGTNDCHDPCPWGDGTMQPCSMGSPTGAPRR